MVWRGVHGVHERTAICKSMYTTCVCVCVCVGEIVAKLKSDTQSFKKRKKQRQRGDHPSSEMKYGCRHEEEEQQLSCVCTREKLVEIGPSSDERYTNQ